MVLGGEGPDQGEQLLRAGYALLGGHVTGANTEFYRARVRLSHLEDWAHLPGVSTTVAVDGSHVHIDYLDPE